jgi:hypothetical protein
MGGEGYVVDQSNQPATGNDASVFSNRQEGLRCKKSSYQFLKRQKF